MRIARSIHKVYSLDEATARRPGRNWFTTWLLHWREISTVQCILQTAVYLPQYVVDVAKEPKIPSKDVQNSSLLLIRPASCMGARASRKARRPGRGLSTLARGAEIRRPCVVRIFRQSGQVHSCVSADVVKWCYVFSYLFHIGYWVCIKYDCLFCVWSFYMISLKKTIKYFWKILLLFQGKYCITIYSSDSILIWNVSPHSLLLRDKMRKRSVAPTCTDCPPKM